MKKKKNSKKKGNRGQNAVAKELREWWGSEFTSTPMSGGFSTAKFRDDWNAAGDIVTPDKTFPFCVEVKWQEDWEFSQLLSSDKCKVWAWWNQCVNETPPGKLPLLVFKRNNHPWYYMIYHADLFKYVIDLTGTCFNMNYEGDLGQTIMIGLFDDFKKMIWPAAIKEVQNNKCSRCGIDHGDGGH